LVIADAQYFHRDLHECYTSVRWQCLEPMTGRWAIMSSLNYRNILYSGPVIHTVQLHHLTAVTSWSGLSYIMNAIAAVCCCHSTSHCSTVLQQLLPAACTVQAWLESLLQEYSCYHSSDLNTPRGKDRQPQLHQNQASFSCNWCPCHVTIPMTRPHTVPFGLVDTQTTESRFVSKSHRC
jgi:hypothetical protein